MDEAYDKEIFGSAMFAWERKKMMVEQDKHGLIPFHHACLQVSCQTSIEKYQLNLKRFGLQGDVKRMKRFVEVVDDLVDMPVGKGTEGGTVSLPIAGGARMIGYSPLMCAVHGGSEEAVSLLVKYGAKVTNFCKSTYVQLTLCLNLFTFCSWIT